MRGFGLTVDLPPAWDASLFQHAAEDGEVAHPVLHAATFPLPAGRGDFGSGAVDSMGRDDVLVVLNEYGPESAGTPLFARTGVPRLHPRDFAPEQLQRPIAGQSGCQRFFTAGGRAFCLYVVLGSHGRRVPLVRRANQLIEGLGIG
jgi:hypothetical protein